MSNLVTPYLPADARAAIAAWRASGKPAGPVALERLQGAACGNCQDLGSVYVSFLAARPTRAPATTKQPSTYIEADGQTLAGWYVIEKTVGFPCPHCDGGKVRTKQQSARPARAAAVQGAMAGLARDIAVTERRDLG